MTEGQLCYKQEDVTKGSDSSSPSRFIWGKNSRGLPTSTLLNRGFLFIDADQIKFGLFLCVSPGKATVNGKTDFLINQVEKGEIRLCTFELDCQFYKN